MIVNVVSLEDNVVDESESVVALLYRVVTNGSATNTKFNPLPLRTKVYHTQTLTSTEHHISSLHSHFWVQLSVESHVCHLTKMVNSCNLSSSSSS